MSATIRKIGQIRQCHRSLESNPRSFAWREPKNPAVEPVSERGPEGRVCSFSALDSAPCCLFKPSKATIAAANRDSVEDASGTIVPRISPVPNWLVWKLI